MRTLITARATVDDPSRASIVAHRDAAETEGFWLDITAPGDEDYQILLDVFGFHPLTVEDVRHQNQRPKFEEYPGYSFVVLFVVECERDALRFREHHLYLHRQYLVTVHQEAAPALDDLRQRIVQNPAMTRDNAAFLTYLVIDRLVDQPFAVLEDLDERIDRLIEGLVTRPRPDDLLRITRRTHDVTELRRFLGAQRDLFQRLLTHGVTGGDAELALYYRDVYDHVVRQYEAADSLRDLLTGGMDIYLSSMSNRLNATIKQLTVVASLFLPLSFLAGFFGMNFGVLVTGIASPAALLGGLGLMVASVVVQLYLFKRSGWI